MLRCQDCELCQRGPRGELVFACEPFSNIKEPECLSKWQLLKLNSLIQYQERIHRMYERLAPMQEKLLQYMEHEIEEQEEAESWKRSLEDDEEEEDEGAI